MAKATLDDIQALQELNRQYVQASEKSDVQWYEAHLAPCFMASNPDGSLENRAGFLGHIGRPNPFRNEAAVDPRVRVVGGVGIVDSGFRCTRPDGREAAGHYTDVYARLDGRWQCVSAHFALRPAPPQTGATRTAAVVAGAPSEADGATLAALNEHYIRAIREADVPWFDTHLAPEFVNANADGSFSDRAAFLAVIAKGSAVSGLRVEDVVIQVVGDTGIVHARTAYTKPDGQPGTGRYTDIWWRADGRWRCVSAHVTRG